MKRFFEIVRESGLAESDIARAETLLSTGDANANRKQLFEQIDDSDYGPADWTAALIAFDQWLAKNGIEARPVPSMIGYIHCCTLTNAKTLPPPPLDGLLVKMLDDYGFDAAQPIQ